MLEAIDTHGEQDSTLLDDVQHATSKHTEVQQTFAKHII